MLNSTDPQDVFTSKCSESHSQHCVFNSQPRQLTFFAPYFINSLGVAGYAMIPLATSYILCEFKYGIPNTSVSRPITIELQKEEFKKANVIFNTALFGTLVIILLMLPVALILSYYSPSFFEIPSNQENSTKILFLGVIIAFLLRTWSSNFGVSIFAYNRLDILNIIMS